MSEVIKFIARDEYSWNVAEKPYPSSQSLPSWWTSMMPYEGTNKLIVENRVANLTPKKCVPMMDAMVNGYIIPLWSDVLVRNEDGFPRITWRVTEDVFQLHGNNANKVQTPIGYYEQPFKFMNKWTIKTPKGYSILIVQPFGYRQTGFQAVPGIIDTDKSTLEILPPVWVQKGFEGVVPKGTPMVQIIPFKRSDWKAEYSYMKDNEYRYLEDSNFNSTLINHYARKVWQKKSYK